MQRPHDLSHRIIDGHVVKAVAKTRLQSQIRIRRHELGFAREMQGQVFDDDARVGPKDIVGCIAQHGELRNGPDHLECSRRPLVSQVDDVGLERRAALVQRDEHFLTIGRKRMEIDLERHGRFPFLEDRRD
jgi:hypothetical protein